MSDLVRQAVVGRRASGAGWVRANCPHCEERVGKVDRDASLAWKPDSGWWGCWRCGARGWLESDAYLLTPALAHEDVEGLDSSTFCSVWDDRSSVLEPARRYLQKRCIPKKTWREASVYASLEGRYAERVIVPVRHADATWVGFAARAWGKREPKVLYPRGMKRDFPLCDPRELERSTREPLLVVEGPFDALRHWPRAAAVLGQPTDAHVALFAEVSRRRPMVVCLDGDAWENGRDFARRLARAGADYVGYLRLPAGVDPGGTAPEDLQAELARGTIWVCR